MSRIPGTKNAAHVTTAPTTPAATSVPRVPMAPATGAVRANYHVVMVAKYKTKSTGKIHTVRSIRTVSIFRK